MILVRITLATSQQQLDSSQVRFWVEPDERSAIAEVEIAMSSVGQGVWAGRVPAHAVGSSHRFLYRLALTTIPGAIWSLQLSDEARQHVVASDSDLVDGCKTWLVGSCSALQKSKVRPSLAAVRV